VNLITLTLYSIGWYSLIPIVILVSAWIYYHYFKNKDKHKLMFAIGVYPSSISFLIFGMGLHQTNINYLIINLYQWGPLPLIIAIFIAVNESIFKSEKFYKLFNIYIVFLIISLLFVFIPISNLIFYNMIYGLLTVEILLVGTFLYFKNRDISILMFILSIICFAIGGMNMSSPQPELGIFAYIMGFTFFGFVFYISSPINDRYNSNLDSYFSIEKKLENVESALKEKEEKYKSMVEGISDIIIELDKDGLINFCSPQCNEILGYKPEELVGKNFIEYVHENDLKNVIQTLDRSNETGDLKEIECRFKHKDGYYKKIVTGGNISKTKSGKNKIIIIIREISDQKKAEQALKESEERYRSFVQNFHGIAFRSSLDWKPIFFHGDVEKITGYKEEEFLNGKIGWDKLIYKDDLNDLIEKYPNSLFLDPNFIAEREYRIIHKNREVRWIHDSIQSICDDSGNILYLQGALYDITDKKRAERELKESEERFKILFEYAPDAYYLTDMDGNFIDGNKVAEDLVGFTKDELIGKNFIEVGLLSENQIEKAVELLEKNMNGVSTGPDDFELNSKDGKKINVEISTIPVTISDNKMILGIAHNITEHKKAKKKINEWKNRYEAAIKASRHVLYDWNCKTNEVRYGGAIEQILGYSIDKMNGGLTRWVELVHPEDRDLFQETLKHLVENAQAGEFEYRVQRKDGKYITVEDTGQFIVDSEGNINSLIGFVKDITDRKMVENAIKKKNANLERFSKLAIGREKKMIELKNKIKELEKSRS
jgi:PAS domain S-box-containing protein